MCIKPAQVHTTSELTKYHFKKVQIINKSGKFYVSPVYMETTIFSTKDTTHNEKPFHYRPF